jgi:regulator of cell morphogenesis and NO signaling
MTSQSPLTSTNTYSVTLDGLKQLEADLHTHIHKENNILFPRAQALENTLAMASV